MSQQNLVAVPPAQQRPGTTPRSWRQSTPRDNQDIKSRFSRLQPATAEKFRQHWTRVSSSFREMDGSRNNLITADELKSAAARMNMNLDSNEFQDVWNCFDTEHSGVVDFNKFQAAMTDILAVSSRQTQFEETNGVSLNIKGACSIVEPKQAFIPITATWNNRYRQPLHTTGEPLVAATVCGAWYFEDREKRYQEVLNERSGKTFFPPNMIQQWDKEGNVPEMTSLMTGRFYGDADKHAIVSTEGSKIRLRKWVDANRKMPHDYGQWLHLLVSKSTPQSPYGSAYSPSATASPRTKRTRVSAAAVPSVPIRALPHDAQNNLRQTRAEEFLKSHNLRSQSTPRPATSGSALQPQPPSSRTPRTPRFYDPDLQELQRSTYRCRWAAPKVDALQRAWTDRPSAAVAQ